MAPSLTVHPYTQVAYALPPIALQEQNTYGFKLSRSSLERQIAKQTLVNNWRSNFGLNCNLTETN